MIVIRVQREPSENGATLGALYVNDRFVCWTLEDAIREPSLRPITEQLGPWVASWKVQGRTAIPAGRYPVVIEYSPRFNLKLPELKQVPGYSEVKFHAGNTAADTDGCILVGCDRDTATVGRSRAALADLLARLHGFAEEPIVVDIENPPGRHFVGASKGLNA